MSNDDRPLTECYVAFLDLMGVRKLTEKAAKDSALCKNIVSALKETKDTSSFSHESQNRKTGETRKWSLQVQAFSDCVVLFIPTETKMLPWILASVRRLHDRLLRLNVPVRGGITVGEMHWDAVWNKEFDGESEKSTPVAFGPGLVSAHNLENVTAVYPRILISFTLYDHVEKHLRIANTFPLGSGKLLDFFRQDADGLYHFDVLHANVNRRDVIRQDKFTNEEGKHVVQNISDETSYADWLEIVRKFIEDGHDNACGEKLKAKYMWLANYYNEKAKDQGGRLIRWFENLVPRGATTLTIKQKKPCDGN